MTNGYYINSSKTWNMEDFITSTDILRPLVPGDSSDECPIDEARSFNGNLAVKGNGLWGIDVPDHSPIIPCKFYEYSSLEGDLLNAERSFVGIIESDGSLILPLEYDFCRIREDYVYVLKPPGRGLNAMTYRMICGIYDETGLVREERVGYKFEGKCGFAAIPGKLITESQYEYVLIFIEGLAPDKYSTKWGFIDKEGSVKIPFKYDSAFFFDDGIADSSRDGKHGSIHIVGIRILT